MQLDHHNVPTVRCRARGVRWPARRIANARRRSPSSSIPCHLGEFVINIKLMRLSGVEISAGVACCILRMATDFVLFIRGLNSRENCIVFLFFNFLYENMNIFRVGGYSMLLWEVLHVISLYMIYYLAVVSINILRCLFLT